MGREGQVCVIKPKKLVRACGLEPTWFNSFSVRRILEDLRWHGLIDLYGGGRHTRYIIMRESPLWSMLTSGDPPSSLRRFMIGLGVVVRLWAVSCVKFLQVCAGLLLWSWLRGIP